MKAVPPTELAEYLDAMPELLIEAPHLANEVATKYVLLSRDDCPNLCTSLKDVPAGTRITCFGFREELAQSWTHSYVGRVPRGAFKARLRRLRRAGTAEVLFKGMSKTL